MAFFDVVFRTEASLHPDDDPSGYVSEYHGIIRCTNERTGTRSKVGKIRVLRLHAGLALDHGEPLHDICDAHSSDLYELYQLLYEPSSFTYRDSLQERYASTDYDTLVIDAIVLHPKWRGLKLGLLALRKSIDMLGGGCGIVAADIQPFGPPAADWLRVPTSWLPLQNDPTRRRQARTKLRNYFRCMGFRRLGKSRFFILPLSLQLPTASDLLRANVGKKP